MVNMSDSLADVKFDDLDTKHQVKRDVRDFTREISFGHLVGLAVGRIRAGLDPTDARHALKELLEGWD